MIVTLNTSMTPFMMLLANCGCSLSLTRTMISTRIPSRNMPPTQSARENKYNPLAI